MADPISRLAGAIHARRRHTGDVDVACYRLAEDIHRGAWRMVPAMDIEKIIAEWEAGAPQETPGLREALLSLRRKDMPDGPCWCSVEPNATFPDHERKCLAVRAALSGSPQGLRPDGYHVGHEVCEDIETDAAMEKAYRETLETHLRGDHGCAHDFGEVANESGRLSGSPQESGPVELVARVRSIIEAASYHRDYRRACLEIAELVARPEVGRE